MRSSWSSTRSAWGGRARGRSSSSGRARSGDRRPARRRAASSAGWSSRATSGRARAAGRRASWPSGPRAGHVLVADLGATSIDVAITDLDGRILGHHDEPSADRGRPGRLPRPRRRAVRPPARGRRTRSPGPCGASASGCPAPSSSRPAGPISPPIMPGWDGYPIRERFAARYEAPVWVDNDVNVLALGEWRSGVAAGHDDVVVVKIGTGIGAGIISSGRLHRGAQGSAGDVGHIQIVDDPAVVCRCGNIGCLEALAGGEAIGRSRGGGGAGRVAAGGCGRRSTSAARDRRGRRPGRLVRRSGRGRAAPGGRPAGRLDARERRELLQPVADRHRRRRREQPGPAARIDPRDGLSPIAAAGDARPAHPAVVAGRAGGRHRGVGDGRRPAVLARRRSPRGSRRAIRPA